MTTAGMRVARDRAFANPAKARKLARDVKKQAELRQRLTKAIDAIPPEDCGTPLLVDAIIEELKK